MERLLHPAVGIWILLALAALVVLVRVRRWLIDHDWLFDVNDDRRALGVAAANALAEIESLYVPSVEHVLEFRRNEEAWDRFLQPGSAEPLEPPSGSPGDPVGA